LQRKALLPALAAILFIIYGGPGALAQSIPLDYESQQRLKTDLAGRVVFVEVTPTPGAFEDPAFIAKRFGQGVPVMREGRAVIVTSWYLVTGAASVVVTSADGSVSEPATVLAELQDKGIAVLSIPPGIAARLARPPAAPAVLTEPDKSKYFYCVTPASLGMWVLTETFIVEKAPFPLEGLYLAPGVLAPGTVLFDGLGVPAAIAARESFQGNGITIVAPLADPPPLPAPQGGTTTGDGTTTDETGDTDDDAQM